MSGTNSNGGSGEGSPPRNNAENTRGKPFALGNPGRPKGSRNKATLAIQSMNEGQLEAICHKVIERALEGDMVAAKLIFGRFPVRDQTICIDLPQIKTANDVAAASASVVEAMFKSEISPNQAAACIGILSAHQKIVQFADHEERIKRLEVDTQTDSKRPADLSPEERAKLLGQIIADALATRKREKETAEAASTVIRENCGVLEREDPRE